MNKYFLTSAIAILIIVITGAVFYTVSKPPAEQIACTMEAKICPDGSAVGRVGPRCEFAVCPSVFDNAVTLEAKLNQNVNALDVGIIPLEVIEDSRCPVDVQCIQAGTVRLRASLSSGLGKANQVFTLGLLVTTEAEEVTLDKVLPIPHSEQKIEKDDYRFFFIIKKRGEIAPGNIGDSGVTGKVLLGPICPVERIPPDPNCAPKPYQTTIQIIKVGSPVSAPFATVNSDKEGKYSIFLLPGNYAFQPAGGSMFPRCETKEVTVTSSKMTEVNLSCDTGIR